MKKKVLAVLLALTMSSSFVACSSGGSTSESEEPAAEATAEESEEEPEEETEEAEEPEAEVTVEVTEEAEEEDSTAEEETEAAADETSDAAVSDAQWVNFDDMSFFVNGKKYTLGVTTLQEMIDDGVPFDESDLANAGNNLNANYESSGFTFSLDDQYYFAQVMVINDSDSGKPMNECVINEIYFPVHQDKEQDILSFAFPLNFTEEELIANAGEADDVYNYEGDNDYTSNEYTYIQESEKYISDRTYEFEFQNGELAYITIEWVP